MRIVPAVGRSSLWRHPAEIIGIMKILLALLIFPAVIALLLVKVQKRLMRKLDGWPAPRRSLVYVVVLSVLLAVHAFVFYECVISSMSDAQGALLWIGGLPVIIVIDTMALFAVQAFRRSGGGTAARVFSLLLAGLFIPTISEFLPTPLRDVTNAVCKGIFISINGKEPWDAGHGR